ncbi:unnamed protein product, partial [marine sediment metagenome]
THSCEEDLNTLLPNPKVKIIKEIIEKTTKYLLNSPFLRIVLITEILKLYPIKLNHLGTSENFFEAS